MAHYAKINEQNIVINVIVAEQHVIDSGVLGDPTTFIQTSYNTFGGKHLQGKTPLRKNYASIGFTYDKKRDAFIPPKPFPSWKLNEETCQWESPVNRPNSKTIAYDWDEANREWVEAPLPPGYLPK